MQSEKKPVQRGESEQASKKYLEPPTKDSGQMATEKRIAEWPEDPIDDEYLNNPSMKEIRKVIEEFMEQEPSSKVKDVDLLQKFPSQKIFQVSTQSKKSSQNMPAFFVRLFFNVLYPKIEDQSRKKQLQGLYKKLKETEYANLDDLKAIFSLASNQAQNREDFYELLCDPETVEKYIFGNNFLGCREKGQNKMSAKIEYLKCLKVLKLRLRSEKLIMRMQRK